MKSVTVVYMGQKIPVPLTEDGNILLEELKGKFGNDDPSEFSFVDTTSCDYTEFTLRGGVFDVDSCPKLFVKDKWMTRKEYLMNQVEEAVRSLMETSKGQKARPTAPSQWTQSVGFSTQPRGFGGFIKPAPFSPKMGISHNLWKSSHRHVFDLVCEILEFDFPVFASAFKETGRIDLKYNSTITEKSQHFDRQDKSHQVIFTLGSSFNGLCVKEKDERSHFAKVATIFCHRKPTAFDGRYQHWVDGSITEASDRIAVVCYLADVPPHLRHKVLTATALKTIYKRKKIKKSKAKK